MHRQLWGFPGGSDSKESTCKRGDVGLITHAGQEDPLEKGMVTHTSMIAWKIPYGQGSLEGYSPLGCKQSDTTERD